MHDNTARQDAIRSYLCVFGSRTIQEIGYALAINRICTRVLVERMAAQGELDPVPGTSPRQYAVPNETLPDVLSVPALLDRAAEKWPDIVKPPLTFAQEFRVLGITRGAQAA